MEKIDSCRHMKDLGEGFVVAVYCCMYACIERLIDTQLYLIPSVGREALIMRVNINIFIWYMWI